MFQLKACGGRKKKKVVSEMERYWNVRLQPKGVRKVIAKIVQRFKTRHNPILGENSSNGNDRKGREHENIDSLHDSNDWVP